MTFANHKFEKMQIFIDKYSYVEEEMSKNKNCAK